ncbi:glycosyltransferase family 4 protein [candidate division KSB1 bacterium]|nr:glycosyltransferase family 4 protein [candidate division KSB1 bacterium]
MKVSVGSVLIIVQNLPVPLDRRVWLEAKSLRSFGYRVSVICPKSLEFNRGHEVIDDIAVYRYPMPIRAEGSAGYLAEFILAWMSTALLSIWIYVKGGFKIIHACNPPDTYFLLAALYKPFGVKFIFDHHDLSPEMYAAKFPDRHGFLLHALYRLEKWTMRSADTVLSTNLSYRHVALTRGCKAPPDVFTVRTGPDLQRLQPRPPRPELRRGKRYLVAYLGEMCPQDGVDYLLRSIHHLVCKRGRRDSQFILVGGGPAQQSLRKQSSQLGLDDWVYFTGRVSDKELCEILSTADLCVDPDPYSRWADSSTMNKIMEYMVFAKPIVAFDLTEHRFSAQNAAVYVRPNDEEAFARSMDDLLDDAPRRQRMGKAGRERVLQHLTWANGERNLLRAYRRTLGDRSVLPVEIDFGGNELCESDGRLLPMAEAIAMNESDCQHRFC